METDNVSLKSCLPPQKEVRTRVSKLKRADSFEMHLDDLLR